MANHPPSSILPNAPRQVAAPAQPDLPHLPIERWLAPKELAAIWGLNEESAYRWNAEGKIPERFVEYCGHWRLRFHPDVVHYLREQFRKAHE